MKLELGTVGFGIGAALVVIVAGVLLARRFVPAVAAAVDPTNPENVFNEGAGAVIVNVTGGAAAGGEDSIGGIAARLREWWSGDAARIEAMKAGAPARTSSSSSTYDLWP